MDNDLNFLINASNQANLSNKKNADSLQMNVVMVLVSPYEIDKLNFEDLDLDMTIDEKGIININGNPFETVEIEPGVRILGISKKGQG